MYHNILVPMALDHDISPATLAVAQRLKSDGGQITAIHVHEALQGSVASFLDKSVVEEGLARVKAAMAKKTAQTPDLKSEVIVGHSYRTIIDYATEHEIDCIVIGSHRPGLGDFLLGSTAARVVRHAKCAVHVHRNT